LLTCARGEAVAALVLLAETSGLVRGSDGGLGLDSPPPPTGDDEARARCLQEASRQVLRAGRESAALFVETWPATPAAAAPPPAPVAGAAAPAAAPTAAPAMEPAPDAAPAVAPTPVAPTPLVVLTPAAATPVSGGNTILTAFGAQPIGNAAAAAGPVSRGEQHTVACNFRPKILKVMTIPGFKRVRREWSSWLQHVTCPGIRRNHLMDTLPEDLKNAYAVWRVKCVSCLVLTFPVS
jgi:hypothetical protein